MRSKTLIELWYNEGASEEPFATSFRMLSTADCKESVTQTDDKGASRPARGTPVRINFDDAIWRMRSTVDSRHSTFRLIRKHAGPSLHNVDLLHDTLDSGSKSLRILPTVTGLILCKSLLVPESSVALDCLTTSCTQLLRGRPW